MALYEGGYISIRTLDGDRWGSIVSLLDQCWECAVMTYSDTTHVALA